MVKKRLTKIYTRSGDQGETGLGDGSRSPKNSPRIEAIGAVDELNSTLAIVASHPLDESLQKLLNTIQNDLFDLGSDLSVPGRGKIDGSYTEWLEAQLDRLNGELPPLKEFILPGGSPAAAHCHHARTVCRRAERRVVALLQQDPSTGPAVQYLNRLSDLLFVIARTIARAEGEELLWSPGSRGSQPR